jgi:hypothetical protein
MLKSQLKLVPNDELKDYNIYEIEEWPGLQLKVYYYAAIQFLWKGRPVPTKSNSELDQRLVLKYRMEAPLPLNRCTNASALEALEFARTIQS